MTLGQRLRRIEKALEKAGIGKQQITLIVVCESDVTDEQKEKAIAEYRANNPDCYEKGISYIYVKNEPANLVS